MHRKQLGADTSPPMHPGVEVRWAKLQKTWGEGKCGAQWALFSLWWRRPGRCTWGERRGWVLGRERSLRIKGKVGKGLLMESKRESVTQERAAESF